MKSDPAYLVVGHVNKPHGTKGELFVWPLTDHPEGVFAPGVILYPADQGGSEPDPAVPSVRVLTSRPFRRGLLLGLAGVEDRWAAEALQGRYLLRPMAELEPPAEGEIFYHQLLGLKVLTTGGEEVGEIVEVYELRPADLLEIRGPEKTHYIPFLASLVEGVDLETSTLVIDPPEGLLDL